MALQRIETDAIADDAVTTAKINADAVNSEHLVDGGVDDVHLATGIDAGKLINALPAISGASLTNLPAANLTGINDNATSTAITITAGESVGIGASPSPDTLLHCYGYSGNMSTSDNVAEFEAAVGSYTGSSIVASNTIGPSSTYSLIKCITDSDGDGGGPHVHLDVKGDGTMYSSMTATAPASGGYVDGSEQGAAGTFHLTDTSSYVINTGPAIMFRAERSAGGLRMLAGIAGRTEGSDSGYLQLLTRSDSAYATERMRITSAGNVGIGVTAPLSQLHMNGNLDLGPYFSSHLIGANRAGAAAALAVGGGATLVGMEIEPTDARLGSGQMDNNLGFWIHHYGSISQKKLTITHDGRIFSDSTTWAWAQFHGQLATIQESSNISSLTDVGTGTWRLNYTTNALDNNHGTVGGGQDGTGNSATQYAVGAGPFNASAIAVTARNLSGTLTDVSYLCAVAYSR